MVLLRKDATGAVSQISKDFNKGQTPESLISGRIVVLM
jgi:hypothetical protein